MPAPKTLGFFICTQQFFCESDVLEAVVKRMYSEFSLKRKVMFNFSLSLLESL